MHGIDTSIAQVDKFGAGKNGFTRGNPQTGTPATELDDNYFDMLQEELAGVVEATGVALDKAKHDQLLTALKTLLLSRSDPFGDIKADGAAAVAAALDNLGLGDTAKQIEGALQKTQNGADILDKGLFVSTIGALLKAGDTMTGKLTLNLDNDVIVIQSKTEGASSYITSKDSAGASQWYVGKGSAGSNNINLHNYKSGASLGLLESGGVAIAVAAGQTINLNGTTSVSGSLTGNGVYDGAERVATTAWVNTNFLAGARRGGQVYQAGSGTGQGMAFEAPAGCYMTGINTNVADGRGMGVYYRALQVYYPGKGYVQIGD